MDNKEHEFEITIEELIKENPNDCELGSKIRFLFFKYGKNIKVTTTKQSDD